jgi:hypothetical protein
MRSLIMANNRNLGIFAATILSATAIGCWQETPKRAVDTPTPTPSATSSPSNSNHMSDNKNTGTPMTMTGFKASLPTGFKEPTDDAGRLLLKEYGAVFVARGGVTPPNTVVFRDQAEVTSFQSSLKTSSENIGGFTLELQTAAMNDLKLAIADAKSQGLTISPRGKDSAKRTYDETIELWKSRVEPALEHWVSKGRMTKADADKLRALPIYEQVPAVLKLEQQGIYFAKDLSKSIIYSVAPPGTSQHLSMLALDLKDGDHGNPQVRAVLAKHFWYQTVISDLPHFTYLGSPEAELPRLGLKKSTDNGRIFWIPEQ